MSLENQIYVRKSCRKYLDDEVDENLIHDFIADVKPLVESIDYSYEILSSDEVKSRTPWKAPYFLALYSEEKEFYKENIGFVFQQLSLYLQSVGIGTCWVGMAEPKVKKDNFVITMSFGKSEDMTREKSGFKRKTLSQISDVPDGKLPPAQLAPSAANSQPWYFKHSDGGFDVYQVKLNFLKRKVLAKWNPVDVGIALSHLYVSNEDTFEFYKKTDFEEIDGYSYTGSIKI